MTNIITRLWQWAGVRLPEGLNNSRLSHFLMEKGASDTLPTGVWGKPQRPKYNLQTLFAAAATNEVVYACIDVACNALTDPRLYVESRVLDGDWQEKEYHPAAMLMRQPNPFHSETEFLRAVYSSVKIAGIFYAEKVRPKPGAPPVAVYPLDPCKMEPVLNQDGSIAYYQWVDGNNRVRLMPEDVMVWRRPDLQARWQAIAPLGVAMGAIAGDSAQTNFVQAFFEGGGQPSGMLTIKDRMLTDEEAEGIRQDWRAKFDARRGGDRRDIAVLNQNMTYQKIGAGLDEIASEQLRGIAETRICMVLGIPPLIIYAWIGLQNSTYSNLAEAWDNVWGSSLTPWLREYRAFLTQQLLTEFEDDILVNGDRVRFNWDLSQVKALQDDLDAISRRALAEWNGGLITRAEARASIKRKVEDFLDNVYVDGTRREVVVDGGAAAGPEIQQLALNGAQIASLLQIAQAVSGGLLAPDAAVTIVRYSFPAIPEDDARAMIQASASVVLQLPDAGGAGAATGGKAGGVRNDKSYAPDQVEMKMLKAVDGARRVLENRFKPKLRSYIAAEYRTAESNLRAGRDAMQGLDDGTRLGKLAQPLYKATISAAYRGAEAQLADLGVAVSFTQTNPFVAETIDGLLKRLKKDIPETTKEQIRKRIADGLAAGDSIDKIADAIAEDAPGISDARATTIARTETADAYTQGSLLAYEESGVVKKVKWLSTLDDVTSDICKALDGQEVDLGSQFEYDGEKFDGAPAHPNCRAAVLPVV